MAAKLLKLNLGCGSNKLKGYVNIDGESACKPDLVCDFASKKLPYKNNTVDEIVIFHCIEHISKRLHPSVLSNFWDILKPGAKLVFSYPEYLKCVRNWEINAGGQKEFWEATLYGRQLYPGDFHVCIMHTPDFVKVLEFHGFNNIYAASEPKSDYYTIIKCTKGEKPLSYETVIKQDMESHTFKRINVNPRRFSR